MTTLTLTQAQAEALTQVQSQATIDPVVKPKKGSKATTTTKKQISQRKKSQKNPNWSVYFDSFIAEHNIQISATARDYLNSLIQSLIIPSITKRAASCAEKEGYVTIRVNEILTGLKISYGPDYKPIADYCEKAMEKYTKSYQTDDVSITAAPESQTPGDVSPNGDNEAENDSISSFSSEVSSDEGLPQ